MPTWRSAPMAADSANFFARMVKISDTNVDFKPKGDKPPVLDSEATVQPHVDILRASQFVSTKSNEATRRSKPPRRPSPPAPCSRPPPAAAVSAPAAPCSSRSSSMRASISAKAIRSGLITYMRTDSVQVSKQAVAEARTHTLRSVTAKFVPKKPPVYKTKSKGAQEAHEAIRPTSVMRTPESMASFLNRPQLQLYTLIWQRFVASQMSPAIYDTLSIEVKAGQAPSDMPYLFRASGRKLKFAGHLAIYGQ